MPISESPLQADRFWITATPTKASRTDMVAAAAAVGLNS